MKTKIKTGYVSGLFSNNYATSLFLQLSLSLVFFINPQTHVALLDTDLEIGYPTTSDSMA